jgi:hypothetical protein
MLARRDRESRRAPASPRAPETWLGSDIIPSQTESQQPVTSHVRDRFYALSIAPLTVIYYIHPGLAVAVSTAVGTVAAVQEYRRRRKPNL